MNRSKIAFLGSLFSLFILMIPTGVLGQTGFFGVYRATVTEVADPMMLGRIKVLAPSVLGGLESNWALPSFAFAGAQHGLILVPELGDSVWIQFEEGDAEKPIWNGAYFNQATPIVGDPAKVRALTTSQGHKIVLDEAANLVEIRHANGPGITLNEDSITLIAGPTTLSITPAGVFVDGQPISTAVFCNGFEGCLESLPLQQ